jgi:hypothetical protein
MRGTGSWKLATKDSGPGRQEMGPAKAEVGRCTSVPRPDPCSSRWCEYRPAMPPQPLRTINLAMQKHSAQLRCEPLPSDLSTATERCAHSIYVHLQSSGVLRNEVRFVHSRQGHTLACAVNATAETYRGCEQSERQAGDAVTDNEGNASCETMQQGDRRLRLRASSAQLAAGLFTLR